MKKQLIIRRLFLVLFSALLCAPGFAQKAKKNSVRLKASYIKIMDGDVQFNMKASSRINRKNVAISNVVLSIYNELDEESILIGKTTTNMNGEGNLVLPDINELKPDSTNTYNIKIAFKGNDSLKKASKNISFKNANIEATVITKDSINYISATLIDASSNSPVVEESLIVRVERLFRPLTIGEDFNYTDENGTIIVPIEEGIPGVDGILTFEVVLEDSDDFGTVKALVKAPVGKPIVDESTFDQRTMWSPRSKTPLFLLIFPNLLIFGIWSLIIYLIINLFKITKS